MSFLPDHVTSLNAPARVLGQNSDATRPTSVQPFSLTSSKFSAFRTPLLAYVAVRVSRQQVRPSVRLYPFPRASNSLLCVEYLSLLSYTRVYKPPRLASSKADICGPLLPLLFFCLLSLSPTVLATKPAVPSLVSLDCGLFRVRFTVFFYL